jgi:hypothetical protein
MGLIEPEMEGDVNAFVCRTKGNLFEDPTSTCARLESWRLK